MGKQSLRRKVMIAAIAAVGGLFTVTYARYRPIIAQAYERVSSGSQIASSRCGPIEYVVKGAGPPVLVVHGAGGGFDQGIDLGAALVSAGFRVIAVSRFGYLRTPLPANAAADAQGDAHACLLDALKIGRVAILGVSAGGPSAMQFALRFPDRTSALVLLVPLAYAPRSDQAQPRRMSRGTEILFETALRSDFLFWAAGKLAPGTFVRSILGTPPELVARAPADEQARVRMILEHILPVRPRRAGLLNDALVSLSLARLELEKIAAPTLSISAADDLYGTFEGARYTAEHVVHGRFIGYPSGGHMLVGRSAQVSSEISVFLRASAR